MSCCKVKITKEEQKNHSNIAFFLKNLGSFLVSLLLVTISFPILYIIVIYLVINSFILNKPNSVSTIVRSVHKGLLLFYTNKDYDGEDEDWVDNKDIWMGQEESDYELMDLEEDEELQDKN